MTKFKTSLFILSVIYSKQTINYGFDSDKELSSFDLNKTNLDGSTEQIVKESIENEQSPEENQQTESLFAQGEDIAFPSLHKDGANMDGKAFYKHDNTDLNDAHKDHADTNLDGAKSHLDINKAHQGDNRNLVTVSNYSIPYIHNPTWPILPDSFKTVFKKQKYNEINTFKYLIKDMFKHKPILSTIIAALNIFLIILPIILGVLQFINPVGRDKWNGDIISIPSFINNQLRNLINYHSVMDPIDKKTHTYTSELVILELVILYLSRSLMWGVLYLLFDFIIYLYSRSYMRYPTADECKNILNKPSALYSQHRANEFVRAGLDFYYDLKVFQCNIFYMTKHLMSVLWSLAFIILDSSFKNLTIDIPCILVALIVFNIVLRQPGTENEYTKEKPDPYKLMDYIVTTISLTKNSNMQNKEGKKVSDLFKEKFGYKKEKKKSTQESISFFFRIIIDIAIFSFPFLIMFLIDFFGINFDETLIGAMEWLLSPICRLISWSGLIGDVTELYILFEKVRHAQEPLDTSIYIRNIEDLKDEKNALVKEHGKIEIVINKEYKCPRPTDQIRLSENLV